MSAIMTFIVFKEITAFIKQAMQMAMLGVFLRDQIRNEEIFKQAKVSDISLKISKLNKWQWAHSLENQRPLGQKGSRVETTHQKTQRKRTCTQWNPSNL